jgi:hypothetical protein
VISKLGAVMVQRAILMALRAVAVQVMMIAEHVKSAVVGHALIVLTALPAPNAKFAVVDHVLMILMVLLATHMIYVQNVRVEHVLIKMVL